LDEQVAPRAPEDGLALRQHQVIEWSVAPGLGSVVDLDAAKLLPPSEEAAPPRRDRLADLVERVRQADPPEPAPCLVATLVTVTTFVRLTAEGLELVQWTGHPDGDGREQRWPVRFEPAVDQPGDVLGLARVGSYEFVLRRFHRSAIVSISDQDWDEDLFLPFAPDVTEGTERTLRDFALSHGFGNGSLCAIELDSLPRAFASPRTARLGQRVIEPSLSFRATSETTAPIRASELNALGLEEAPATAIAVTAEAAAPLISMAARLADAAPSYCVVVAHRVTETWVGDGTAVVSRVLRGAEPAWPTLDDSGQPAEDFAVCTEGHLHEPDRQWSCARCQRTLCCACGRDGYLAPCPQCSVECCGRCSTTEHGDVPAESCGLCLQASCRRCGRTIGSHRCPVCRREACDACWAGPWCAGCERMRTSAPAPITLPDELVAGGLLVRADITSGTTVALLDGAQRRELAVVSDDAVASWWTLSGEGEALHRIRLGLVAPVAQTGDVAVEIVSSALPPDPSRGSLVLLDQSRTLVLCELNVPSGRQRIMELEVEGPLRPQPSDGDLQALSSGVRVPIPERLDGAAAEALASLIQTLPLEQPVVPAQVRLGRELDMLVLNADGLHSFTGVQGDSHVESAPWRPHDGPTPHWSPEPDRHLTANLRGLVAHLVAWGPWTWLAVETPSGLQEHTIHAAGDVDVHDAVLLALQLGWPEAAVAATSAVPPTGPSALRVNGWERVASTFSLSGAGHGRPSAAATHDLAHRLNCDPTVRLPGSDALPLEEGLRSELAERLFGSNPVLRAVDVSIEVTETWTKGDRRHELTCIVTPAGGPTGVLAEDTGALATEVEIDDAGHVVEHLLTCFTCDGATCARCEGRAAPCTLCRQPVCGGCAVPADGARLCPACSSLEPIGRLRLLAYPGARAVLRGSARTYQVETVVLKNGEITVSARWPHQKPRSFVLSPDDVDPDLVARLRDGRGPTSALPQEES
jgi:hypothetical protein